MRIYAHRGSHRSAPENTQAAFQQAIADGADGVELDARRTRSGDVVVFHDADLRRLGGSPMEVERVSLSRLRRATVGGEPIPTLDETLDLVVGAGLEVNIELKGASRTPSAATAEAVARTLARRSASDRAAIFASSFDPRILLHLRWRLPSLRAALLFEREALRDRAMAPFVHGVHPRVAACTPARVRRWKRRYGVVNVWTLDDPERARELASMGVDGVITDDVPRMRAGLAS